MELTDRQKKALVIVIIVIIPLGVGFIITRPSYQVFKRGWSDGRWIIYRKNVGQTDLEYAQLYHENGAVTKVDLKIGWLGNSHLMESTVFSVLGHLI
ncbi:MAG: hypothetical protein ACFFD4_36260 [Candidatus Odinarchaeota archaeon]